MKSIFTIIFFFTLSVGFCQNGELNGRIFEKDEFGFPGLVVELIKDGESLYKTQTDFDGNYAFKNIPFGTYSIKISCTVIRDEIYENIVIDSEKEISNLTYPKPCVSSKKVCPKGHTKNIIPIVYGFPNKKMMKKAKNKKLKLGGCSPYCEKWHCTEHDLDF